MKLVDNHSSHSCPERGDDAIIVSFPGFEIACFLMKDLRPAAATGFDISIPSRDQRDDQTARHCSALVNIGCTTPVLTILTAWARVMDVTHLAVCKTGF